MKIEMEVIMETRKSGRGHGYGHGHLSKRVLAGQECGWASGSYS